MKINQQPQLGKHPKSAEEIIDLYFNDIRSSLLETAAFLDRVERIGGEELLDKNPHLSKIIKILKLLPNVKRNRAEELLMLLSEPSKRISGNENESD